MSGLHFHLIRNLTSATCCEMREPSRTINSDLDDEPIGDKDERRWSRLMRRIVIGVE